MELLCRYSVFAEGARGHLGCQLIERFKLAEGKDPQSFALGLQPARSTKAGLHRIRGDGAQTSTTLAKRIRLGDASLIDEVQELGLSVRAGVHTGEITRRGDRAAGVAVHVGARIMSLAAPNELLVSGIVRDQVGGSRIGLVDRGDHPPKGLAGTFRLHGLAR